MERVLPVNAVKASIDWFFSERILKENQKESDKILPSIEVDEEGRTYVHKAIDTRDNDILKEMALILFDKFLKYHPDNTLELFIESHIEKAKRRQSYFPNYKIDNIQKEYFFKLERWIKAVKALDTQQTATIIKQKAPNKLSDIIIHEKGMQIVESIKHRYKNIKGKQLKLLLLAFQELELLPTERIANQFHSLCKNEFEWNIASYNAMNGYVFNEVIDEDDKNKMKLFLETIIKTN
jgi:hypothetical protein